MRNLTVFNGSPHPIGFASGKVTINLAIGATGGISEEDLLRELAKKKSALPDEVLRGTLRLDGFYPSQVLHPRKPQGAKSDVDIPIDPDKPRPPKIEIKPLYSTLAPCPKMMGLLEQARKPARAQRQATFAIEVPEAEPALDIQAWLAARGISEADLLRELAKKGSAPAEVEALIEPEPVRDMDRPSGEMTMADVKPVEEMTVPEIRAYLDERGIVYPKSALKADLLELALSAVQE